MLLLFKETVTKELNDIKESQQFLSDLVDELRKENETIVKENQQLKEHSESLRRENRKYRGMSLELEGEINKIKQDKLVNNIVITNMPKSDNHVRDF